MGAPKVNLYNPQELFSRTIILVKFGVSISFCDLLNWMDFRLSNDCKKQLGKKILVTTKPWNLIKLKNKVV